MTLLIVPLNVPGLKEPRLIHRNGLFVVSECAFRLIDHVKHLPNRLRRVFIGRIVHRKSDFCDFEKFCDYTRAAEPSHAKKSADPVWFISGSESALSSRPDTNTSSRDSSIQTKEVLSTTLRSAADDLAGPVHPFAEFHSYGPRR